MLFLRPDMQIKALESFFMLENESHKTLLYQSVCMNIYIYILTIQTFIMQFHRFFAKVLYFEQPKCIRHLQSFCGKSIANVQEKYLFPAGLGIMNLNQKKCIQSVGPSSLQV